METIKDDEIDEILMKLSESELIEACSLTFEEFKEKYMKKVKGL